MTNKEAIDIIKCLAWHTRPNEEDVEQAIKALEQKPCVPMRDLSEEELKHFAEEMKKVRPQVVKQESCDDCISRQAAIDELELQAKEMSQWSERYMEQAKGVLTAKNIIKDLPPVTLHPKTEWIPVSEKLPEGATNGDMIKAMFPNIEIEGIGGVTGLECVAVSIGLGTSYFALDWWNAPYKKESEVKK